MSYLIDFLIPQFDDVRIIRAIQSIKQHRRSDRFRIIIQDGGTDDDLQQRIKQQLRPHDLHILERDKGIFDALNKASNHVNSPWVGWFGADDILYHDFNTLPLEECGSHVHFVSYTTLMFQENGAIHRVYASPNYAALRLIGMHVPHFSTFLRRHLLRSQAFDLTYGAHADILYFLMLERRYNGVTVRAISTLMAVGGISNSGVPAIIQTNLRVLRDVASAYGLLYGFLFCSLKIGFKVVQRAMALIFYRDYSVHELKLIEKKP